MINKKKSAVHAAGSAPKQQNMSLEPKYSPIKVPEIQPDKHPKSLAINSNLFNKSYTNKSPVDNEKIEKIAEDLKLLLSKDDIAIVDKCINILRRNEFVIMIAGEVSVGKSSFLNALIGEPVLITDLKETTAVITYLRSAEGNPGSRADHAKVTYLDGKVNWIPLDKDLLKKATTSLDGNDASKKVQSVDVYFSKEKLNLPTDITIIDTPGLNGNVEHSNLTRREMGACHAALFLFDASKLAANSERDELHHLYEYAPEVLFVISKLDDVRKVQNANELKLKCIDSLGRLSSDGNTLHSRNLFILSSKEVLEAYTKQRLNPEDKLELPEDNEFFALSERLYEVMTSGQKRKHILTRPLQTMRHLADNKIKTIEDKISKYPRPVNDDVIEMERNKIQIKQLEINSIITEIEKFSQDMASIETENCKWLVAQKKPILELQLKKYLSRIPGNSILHEKTNKEIKAFLEQQIKNEIIIPVSNVIDAFFHYLKQLFATQADFLFDFNLKQIGSDFKNQMPSIESRQKEFKTNLMQFLSNMNMLEGQLSDIQSQISALNKALLSAKDAKKKQEALKEKKELHIQNRESLGKRPQPRIYETYEDYTVTIDRRPLSLWRIFKGPTYEEHRERTIQHKDYTKQKKWDAEMANINDQIAAIEEKIYALDEAINNGSKASKQVLALEKKQNRLQQQIEDIKIEELAQRKAFERYALKEKINYAQSRWLAELRDSITRLEGAFFNIKMSAAKLINDFKDAQALQLRDFFSHLEQREKKLLKEKSNSIAGLNKLKEERIILNEIVQVLNYNLELLNPNQPKGN